MAETSVHGAQIQQDAALSDEEFGSALAELAEFERRIAESDRLAQSDSMRTAAVLDRLYRDQRWVEERNAERAVTAKTAVGGRPVDPTSRSQFSTWLRGRFRRIDPSRTYQLLDAHAIATSYFDAVEITPTCENQLRPLKVLLKAAHGGGERIPEVWEIAVKLADGEQPTHGQVRDAIAEWKRLHLTAAQQRKESAADRAARRRGKAVSAWRELVAVGSSEDINAFLDVVRADVELIEATGKRA
jgi:hypothetical protein